MEMLISTAEGLGFKITMEYDPSIIGLDDPVLQDLSIGLTQDSLKATGNAIMASLASGPLCPAFIERLNRSLMQTGEYIESIVRQVTSGEMSLLEAVSKTSREIYDNLSPEEQQEPEIQELLDFIDEIKALDNGSEDKDTSSFDGFVSDLDLGDS